MVKPIWLGWSNPFVVGVVLTHDKMSGVICKRQYPQEDNMKEDILIMLDNYEGYSPDFQQNILSEAYDEIAALRDLVRTYAERCNKAVAAINGEDDD